METNKQTRTKYKWFYSSVPGVIREQLSEPKNSPKHNFIFGSFIMLFGISIVKLIKLYLSQSLLSNQQKEVGYGSR